MRQRQVDISSHFNSAIERGNPADFDIKLKSVYYLSDEEEVMFDCNIPVYKSIPNRFAVVRTDTGAPLSVVSDKYTVVKHQDILEAVNMAIKPLDVGPTPSGVFVDRGGARLRALYKFPSLSRRVQEDSEICPCIKIQNTYDGTSRVSIHIGAFRFVCTNLAVGGGGSFAGGFMSIHAGTIDISVITKQLSFYLSNFDRIVETYRLWADRATNYEELKVALEGVGKLHSKELLREFSPIGSAGTIFRGYDNVYRLYNRATDYATHKTRTANSAFDLLAAINAGFQKTYPVK